VKIHRCKGVSLRQPCVECVRTTSPSLAFFENYKRCRGPPIKISLLLSSLLFSRLFSCLVFSSLACSSGALLLQQRSSSRPRVPPPGHASPAQRSSKQRSARRAALLQAALRPCWEPENGRARPTGAGDQRVSRPSVTDSAQHSMTGRVGRNSGVRKCWVGFGRPSVTDPSFVTNGRNSIDCPPNSRAQKLFKTLNFYFLLLFLRPFLHSNCQRSLSYFYVRFRVATVVVDGRNIFGIWRVGEKIWVHFFWAKGLGGS